MGLTLPAKRARCIVKTSFAALCIIIIGGFFMLSFVLPGCDGRDIRNTLSALRGSIAQVKSYILYGSSKLMLNITTHTRTALRGAVAYIICGHTGECMGSPRLESKIFMVPRGHGSSYHYGMDADARGHSLCTIHTRYGGYC